MNRELTDHKVNGCNEGIEIAAMGLPGPGGASVAYRMTIPNDGLPFHIDIPFQNGDPAIEGTNGATHESLLAILIDRLRGFQDGTFKCRENALALTKLEEAMHWLNARTKARVARGVEGMLQV